MSINSVRSYPSPQTSKASDPQAPAVPKTVYDWKEASAQRAADSSLDSGPLRPAANQDSYTVAKNPAAGFSGGAAPANAGNPKMAHEGYQPAPRTAS